MIGAGALVDERLGYLVAEEDRVGGAEVGHLVACRVTERMHSTGVADLDQRRLLGR